jgi:uroporphyrinogen-III synthase
MDYSADGLAALLKDIDFSGQNVLRLRSEKAGPLLADVLRQKGATVDDVQLYVNEPIRYPSLPACDAVFFASASAVEAFMAQTACAWLSDKVVVVIGKPTATALASFGRVPDVVADQATVDGAMEALARLLLFA